MTVVILNPLKAITRHTFVMRSVSRLANLLYLIYELFPSTLSFPQWTHEMIEVRQRKLPLHLLRTYDIHENSSYLCQTPQGGSSEHEACSSLLHFISTLS